MTQTPTDPIRDEAVKVLAEALQAAIKTIPVKDPRDVAADTLDASPTLARLLTFTLTWDAAVAALPEGWEGPAVFPSLRSGWWARATAFDPNQYVEMPADTPDAALAALAAKLGSGK